MTESGPPNLTQARSLAKGENDPHVHQLRNKQNVVYTRDTRSHTGDLGQHHTKWKKPDRRGHVSYDTPRTGKSTEKEHK